MFAVEFVGLFSHRHCVSHLDRAREVFDIEIAALKKVRAQLDKAFNAAVDVIIEALRRRGKIVIIGIGKSGNVGQKIAATLTSTGSTSVVLNSVDALHGDLGIINDGDVILALSYSGESEELLNLLPALKRFSVKIISFTGNLKSSLARHSDLSLNVKVPKEACPFNLAPTSSTTAMLALGDALAMAVLQARGFRQKDFRQISSQLARSAGPCCLRVERHHALGQPQRGRPRGLHRSRSIDGNDAGAIRQP
jgi:arabinose-5-phosphate isomerase